MALNTAQARAESARRAKAEAEAIEQKRIAFYTRATGQNIDARLADWMWNELKLLREEFKSSRFDINSHIG